MLWVWVPCTKIKLWSRVSTAQLCRAKCLPFNVFLQDLLQTCGKISSNFTASCFLLPRSIAWNGLVHLVGLFLECRFMLLAFFATETITCQKSSDLQPSKLMHSGQNVYSILECFSWRQVHTDLIRSKTLILVFFSAAFCWPQKSVTQHRNIRF